MIVAICQTKQLHTNTFCFILYYKERRQLKIFLTQIRFVLPLTPIPPVICFWKWIRWKDYEVPKNRNFESVSAKKSNSFLTRTNSTHFCTHLFRLLMQGLRVPAQYMLHGYESPYPIPVLHRYVRGTSWIRFQPRAMPPGCVRGSHPLERQHLRPAIVSF
jgi:hypothetical protein